MGEEEKKPEQARKEAEGDAEKLKAKEEKKEEAKGEEGKNSGDGVKEGSGEEKKADEPPPEEIVMRVFMHCEGCARKVKRCLKGFEGVEDVKTDCRTHKVVVKGKKAAENPMKVVERVQKKTGRKVELLTPLPLPKPEKKEEEEKEEEKPKQEEMKEEPQVIAVVLKVPMHCEACSQEIKKRILKMKGVQAAEPDLKASEVTVKGVFEPLKLVEYVHKRTGKHAAVAKQDPPEKKAEDAKGDASGGDAAANDEKKSDAAGEKKEDKEGCAAADKDKDAAGGGDDGTPPPAKMGDKHELYQHCQRCPPPGYVGYGYTSYPAQIFSDENPNACAVM